MRHRNPGTARTPRAAAEPGGAARHRRRRPVLLLRRRLRGHARALPSAARGDLIRGSIELREEPHADRADRGPALRCRLAHLSFLKITTDDGVVGWSEYNESYGSRGLTAVIRKLAERLIGSTRARSSGSRQCSTRSPARRRAGCPAGDRRARERAGRPQGARARRAGRRAARRPGARPAAALLVALRLLPPRPRRDDGHAAGALARRPPGARPRGARAGLQRAQDQHLPLRPRRALHAPAGLRPQRRLAGAERRPPHPAHHRRPDGGVPRRRRRRGRPAARPQLQLQDRGLSRGGARDRALRPDVAGDRLLRPAGAGADPPRRAHADRVLQVAVRPPPVPAVPRRPGDGRRDRRRALERHPREA